MKEVYSKNQAAHSLQETNRKHIKAKNNHGNPIRLPSKILAVIADPSSPTDAVYVAESAGNARRIVVDTGEKSAIYRGPTAPLTSLALSPNGATLFAGCWDKSIWSWDTRTRSPQRRYQGHTDFVKAVLTLRLSSSPKTDILISGSSDATIIIWSIDSGKKLHTLQSHLRGVLDLAIDPLTYNPLDTDSGEVVFFSADSYRKIRRWKITSGAHVEEIDSQNPIVAHETSVYALRFDSDGDLWTASADGTAKCLSREHGWKTDTELAHGDYVRSVAVGEEEGVVVTAGRDEDLKVWERGSGNLVRVFDGHWEEVMGLVILQGRVVSVSIDGTLRTWGLKPEESRGTRQNGKQEQIDEEKHDGGGGNDVVLTEEEERELAEIMADE
ncbi:MAG: hypothetical protein Q9167_001131 [Letrouitia subvulpina]